MTHTPFVLLFFWLHMITCDICHLSLDTSRRSICPTCCRSWRHCWRAMRTKTPTNWSPWWTNLPAGMNSPSRSSLTSTGESRRPLSRTSRSSTLTTVKDHTHPSAPQWRPRVKQHLTCQHVSFLPLLTPCWRVLQRITSWCSLAVWPRTSSPWITASPCVPCRLLLSPCPPSMVSWPVSDPPTLVPQVTSPNCWTTLVCLFTLLMPVYYTCTRPKVDASYGKRCFFFP